jgi:phage terminase large subunit-like protein
VAGSARKPARKEPADPVTAYARAVMAGRIVAGPYVRLACERHLRDLQQRKQTGLVWNLARAHQAIAFYPTMLCLEDGRPFQLEPYQQFIVGSLFGWYGSDGHRRFRTSYVEMGKGSGKSPLAAGVGLYGLVLDDESAPEVYAAATARDQAKIVFGDAKRMVEAEAELRELVEVHVGSLSIPARHAVFRPVSSEHRQLDGLRVHIGLIDELHEHPTSLVVDKIRAGTKARRDALIFEITNSGFDRTSTCWAHHDHSVKVLQGTIQNDAWFAYVCALDEGDDWHDERVWLKSNPGLGVTLPISYLREQVQEAVGMPSKENIVRRLNFCEWTEQAERWLDMQAWEACGGKVDIDALRGRPCMAALDGASTQDLFAFSMLFGPDENGILELVSRFWIPEATLTAQGSGRAEKDRLALRHWADEGWITVTPGNVTDYDLVEAQILEELAKYELKRLAFDRWNVTQLITHLRDALGAGRVVDFPQTMAAMSAPSKELEKRLKEGAIRHGDNPVLRWMASNVAAREGPNGQIKPDRERSGEKIDGIVTLVMALDGAMRAQPRTNDDMTVIACG